MIDFTIETHIDRPASEVFAYATDPGKLPTWQTNTVSSVVEGDGPLALGARLREVHRAPGGKELESLVEVSEFEPERVFALHVLEGTPVHLRMTFSPEEEGTRVAFRAFGQLGGAMRLRQPVLGRVLKRQFTAQLAELRRVLESAARREEEAAVRRDEASDLQDDLGAVA
jgi:uncharacterized protein YndB with AHSA1/START domain